MIQNLTTLFRNLFFTQLQRLYPIDLKTETVEFFLRISEFLNKSLIQLQMKKLLWIALFAVAMAYVEASVVVYLRKIFYPSGFSFPLKLITNKIALIEIGRELATILMLISVAWACEKKFICRFWTMLFAWGIWDIFYYLWLKVFLNWPSSFFTKDLLFLIPVPWVAPILAPVLVSLVFISGRLILDLAFKCKTPKIKAIEAILFVSGSGFILYSFVYDWFATDLTKNSNPPFLWGIFLIGLSLLLFSIILPLKNNYNTALNDEPQ